MEKKILSTFNTPQNISEQNNQSTCAIPAAVSPHALGQWSPTFWMSVCSWPHISVDMSCQQCDWNVTFPSQICFAWGSQSRRAHISWLFALHYFCSLRVSTYFCLNIKHDMACNHVADQFLSRLYPVIYPSLMAYLSTLFECVLTKSSLIFRFLTSNSVYCQPQML